MYTDLFDDSSAKRIHIVYVYHVLVAYHLTWVQMGTFIGKNDSYCVFQGSTALVTVNVCLKKISSSYAAVICTHVEIFV